MQLMARLRSGQPLGPVATVEEAAATVMAPAQTEMIERMSANWIVDEPVAAAARIRSLAAEFGVDEVMVQPVGSAHAGAAIDASPARLRTLELIAEQLLTA